MSRHTSSRYGAAALLLLLGLAGCPDPKGEFDDFVARVPDATVIRQIDAAPLETIPDISGTFLLAVSISLRPEAPVLFRAEATLVQNTDGTAKVSMVITALDKVTHEPAARAVPTPLPDPAGTTVNTSKGGEFNLGSPSVFFPKEANPLLSLDVHAAPIMLQAAIKSPDRFCGGVDGMVMETGTSLAGSTFSAVRIDPDAPASELPEPEIACPGAAGTPDAGVSDAGDPT